MNDELAWVIQAQQGNDEAFTRLVEEYQTHVYNLCYRMLGEPEAAEDAAQETFLRAYQNLRRYDQTRSFATWLLSIGAHYCIDRLRRLWSGCFLGRIFASKHQQERHEQQGRAMVGTDMRHGRGHRKTPVFERGQPMLSAAEIRGRCAFH